MTRHGPGAAGAAVLSLSLGLAAIAACASPPVRDARPAYLANGADTVTGCRVTRVSGNPGEPLQGAVHGVWGTDSRHHYSKDQPWNADGSLLAIENRGGGEPTVVLLDGNTYQPLHGRTAYKLAEFRWHPRRANIQIGLRAPDSLVWYDPIAERVVRGWKLPIRPIGIGLGEGNTSDDGRFLALANRDSIVIVDMDPQPPNVAYADGNRRFGPVYAVGACSLDVAAPEAFDMGNASVSSSGHYVDLKFGGRSGDSTADAHRIYEVDSTTLALKPHTMADASLRCGSFQARPNGWIFPTKHADLARDPFDGDEDVIIGGRSCPGSDLGRVVMVRLRDGKVTALTDPHGEASVWHVSTRNLQRPGWAYVTYLTMPGKRYSGQIVAVKLDGSLTVEPITSHHSVSAKCYRCEAQAVPSPDGRRVMFASNWAEDCPECAGEISAFVADTRRDSLADTHPR